MYGLASRDSLSKRQSRWVREVDESVRSNPAQRAINQESSSNSTRPSGDRNSIITFMPSYDTDSSVSLASNQNSMLRKTFNHPSNKSSHESIYEKNSSDALSSLVSELKHSNNELLQKYSKLENDYNSVSELSIRMDRIEQQQNPIHNLDSRITRLESDIPIKYTKIQPILNNIPSLITRIQNLELSLSELSSRSEPLITFKPFENTNSSEFSAPTDNSEIMDIQEFVPFFIREEYAGRDNRTILDKNTMNMTVDIVGLFNETPVIYPFGMVKNLPRYMELHVDMTFTDAEKSVNGVIYGIFKQEPNGIYIIKITELYSDGEASEIDKFILPLTITCTCDLLLE
jgi:uncharacterized protein YoxC